MNSFHDTKCSFRHRIPGTHHLESFFGPLKLLECVVEIAAVFVGVQDVDCGDEDDGVEGVEDEDEPFVVEGGEEVEEGALGAEDVETGF